MNNFALCRGELGGEILHKYVVRDSVDGLYFVDEYCGDSVVVVKVAVYLL